MDVLDWLLGLSFLGLFGALAIGAYLFGAVMGMCRRALRDVREATPPLPPARGNCQH